MFERFTYQHTVAQIEHIAAVIIINSLRTEDWRTFKFESNL